MHRSPACRHSSREQVLKVLGDVDTELLDTAFGMRFKSRRQCRHVVHPRILTRGLTRSIDGAGKDKGPQILDWLGFPIQSVTYEP